MFNASPSFNEVTTFHAARPPLMWSSEQAPEAVVRIPHREQRLLGYSGSMLPDARSVVEHVVYVDQGVHRQAGGCADKGQRDRRGKHTWAEAEAGEREPRVLGLPFIAEQPVVDSMPPA